MRMRDGAPMPEGEGGGVHSVRAGRSCSVRDDQCRRSRGALAGGGRQTRLDATQLWIEAQRRAASRPPRSTA